MSTLEVNKITPQGTGTTVTLGDSGDSIDITSGATVTNFKSTGIDDNATSTAVTINSSQNVSIGKTSSAGKSLELYADTNAAMRIQNSTTGTGSGDGLLIEMGGSDALIYNYENGVMKFGTNNAEKMRIDDNGQVSKPAQASFRAGRNGNYTPGNGNDIVFNTVTQSSGYNVGNHYNTSNGRFTAPVTGRYLFITQVLWGPSISDGTNMIDSIRFTVNGSPRTYGARRSYYRNSYTGDGGYYGDHTNDIFWLNANDYVTVRSFRSVGVHGNDQYTIFTGYFLG